MPPPESTRAELGRAVRRLREARGLTIEGLADAAGMHVTYLSGIERGRFNPSWDKLCALAYALNISIVELAQEVERS